MHKVPPGGAVEPTSRRRPGEDTDNRQQLPRAPHDVVVGIDGSPASVAALRWALGYADKVGASVHAVSVWYEPVQIAGADLAPMSSDSEREARRWLTNALSGTATGTHLPRVQTHLEEGDPSKVLLDYALDAELLVLGNHGHGALQALALGSVAQRCAHDAVCPVLLVPG